MDLSKTAELKWFYYVTCLNLIFRNLSVWHFFVFLCKSKVKFLYVVLLSSCQTACHKWDALNHFYSLDAWYHAHSPNSFAQEWILRWKDRELSFSNSLNLGKLLAHLCAYLVLEWYLTNLALENKTKWYMDSLLSNTAFQSAWAAVTK